jgi:hypothetical protein
VDANPSDIRVQWANRHSEEVAGGQGFTWPKKFMLATVFDRTEVMRLILDRRAEVVRLSCQLGPAPLFCIAGYFVESCGACVSACEGIVPPTLDRIWAT